MTRHNKPSICINHPCLVHYSRVQVLHLFALANIRTPPPGRRYVAYVYSNSNTHVVRKPESSAVLAHLSVLFGEIIIGNTVFLLDGFTALVLYNFVPLFTFAESAWLCGSRGTCTSWLDNCYRCGSGRGTQDT